jgi:hypothetical protein
MVNVGASEKNSRDGGIAGESRMRRQFRIGAKVKRQIGRSINQKPIAQRIAHGDRGLSLWLNATKSGLLAISAGAVPLRKPSTRSNP